MSDYLAVGGVSAVLKSLLANALTAGGPSSILGAANGITNKAPDLVTTGPDETPQLNLFMYYASINSSLRNIGLPSMGAGGQRLSNPPLTLNLHYLVTAYGAAQYEQEILLAWAMYVLHNTPVVSRDLIEQALSELTSTPPVSIEQTLIAGSSLPGQVEHIRITPETLTTEEIYRLWTAFQTHYRPTTSYQVSVVVIEDTQSFQSNLPVQRRSVLAQPLIGPVIEAVTPVAAVGQVLTITGRNFLGDAVAETTVSFNGAASIAAATVTNAAVTVAVPATLFAGVVSVRVLRSVVFPSSSTPHPAFSSNPAPFQLVPVIQPPPLPPPAALPKVKRGDLLTLTLVPVVGSLQAVTVFLGDQALPVPSRPADSATVSVTVPATFAAGAYPLRVEVDGAQSRLVQDKTAPLPRPWLPQIEVTL